MAMLKKISGYLLRICVFQLGEYKRGPFARFLIRLLKRTFDLSDKKAPLGFKALDHNIMLMEELGGLRLSKTAADGLANIDFMLLTFDNVKRKIEEKGGKWVEVPIISQIDPLHYKASENGNEQAQYISVVFCENETPVWKDFCNNVLNEMQWPKATLEFSNKQLTVFVAGDLLKTIQPQKKACFLRCHSPGRSYASDKKYIGKHLSLKKDLCLFNYRGTHRSTGEASEGGYYLDSDALFQELITTYGYKSEQIWVTGFCLGGAVAAYIKAKYHDLGVNYVGENTFTKIVAVIENQPWPANRFGLLSLESIQSLDPLITSKVKQDLFNTLEKLNSLPTQDKKGKTIIISTDADTILPRESGLTLYSIAKKSSHAYYLEHKSLKQKNPHADDVFEEYKIWLNYSEIVNRD